ncbi:hypothetical protein ELQ90_02720 [Labedella phragmitis]|uniref:Uncharacterized protein n=1 Tax=Labedella phragmitis TaxID=2498849 RepID=A0A444PYA2_9MICO|nr:hypothetical protein [Labedella phragmitis]RWZ52870.1 hypothetical protein ELQ90_02720 [Labedella phragmitis]
MVTSSAARALTAIVTRISSRSFLSVVAVVLIVVGVGLVWVDARARIDAVGATIRSATSQQAGVEYYRDLVDTPEFRRWVVIDALVNDTTPRVSIVQEGDAVLIRAGAFGTGLFESPRPRPWSPRFVTVPLIIGVVLGIALTLDAAAHHTPVRPRAPRAGRRPAMHTPPPPGEEFRHRRA